MSTHPELPDYRTLQTSVENGVGTVTLHRPAQRNAIGGGMREELADAYVRFDRDDAVRVVVLTGTPPAFCAGADLGAGDRTFAAPGPGFSAAGIDVPAWSLSKPVIAAVNGHALGLGLTLALQLPAALELAHDIAVNTAPMSVAASKRLLWESFDLDREAVGARETEIHRHLMGHDDAREGVRAFQERRAPRWTGRPADPTRNPGRDV